MDVGDFPGVCHRISGWVCIVSPSQAGQVHQESVCTQVSQLITYVKERRRQAQPCSWRGGPEWCQCCGKNNTLVRIQLAHQGGTVVFIMRRKVIKIKLAVFSHQNYVSQGKSTLSHQNMKRKDKDFPLDHCPAWASWRFNAPRTFRVGGAGSGLLKHVEDDSRDFLAPVAKIYSSDSVWQVWQPHLLVVYYGWTYRSTLQRWVPQRFISDTPWMLMGVFIGHGRYPAGTPWNPWRQSGCFTGNHVPHMSRKKQEPESEDWKPVPICVLKGWTYRKLEAIFLFPHLLL